MKCSELFNRVFDSRCGGCVRTCKCGITYFDGDHINDFDEGELEELLKKAKKDPKHYIEIDRTVGIVEIDGDQTVYGCPCGIAKRYEDFIKNHATQIAEYLNKRAKLLREKADLIEVRKNITNEKNY